MATFLSKYNTARHIYIPIVKRAVVDFAVSADWTPAAGDVKISKDGGAAANVTNLPTAITMGNTAMWDFSLTATELSCAQAVVMVADSATKAVEDQSFVIETYGNASAQHLFDLGTATQSVNVSSINSVSAASVTTINANQGTTQPINFTGTGASALAKSDMVDIAGAAVSASTAQIGANAVQFGGAPVTATTSVTIPAASTLATTTGAVGSVTAGVTVTTNNDKTGYGLSAAAVQAIWDALTTALTTVGSIGKWIVDKLDVAVSTRLASAGYTAPLDAAGTRTAVGLASANLDTQLSALQADTDNIQTRLPAALTGAGNMKSDVLALNGDATAAATLAILNGANVVYRGTVTGATSTTTLIDSGLTQADTDWWKGRIIIFTSGITLQARDITAFDPATDKLTFSAVTTAPTAGPGGSTYVII